MELMVAMTIGFVILAGVGYMYVESRQLFRGADSLGRIQESARYALEIMARDIRMAGYRGCASSGGKFTNVLKKKDESAYNFDVPINGYDGGSAGWTPALPADTGGLSGLSILAGTDAIILRSAFGGGVTVTDHNPPAATIKVTEPHDLVQDDIVMVTDCTNAAVFQISNLNPSSAFNVVHNTGGKPTPGNEVNNLGHKFEGGEIIKMQSKTYFIRAGASGRPALWQFDNYKALGGDNPAEIAEGVENMQIQYGIDANGDGVVESYAAASAVADWKQVAAVRISLLVAGNDDNLAPVKQKYNYNGAQVEAPDLRLRQVFTSTVSVRNRTQ